MTDRERELKATLKELKANYDKWNEERDNLYREYFKMEGMYSIGTKASPRIDMHDRGYEYVYTSSKMKEKEIEERKKFWKENNLGQRSLENPYQKDINEIENLICIEHNGYDLEEKKRRQALKRYEKELLEIEERRAYVLQKIEKLNKKD